MKLAVTLILTLIVAPAAFADCGKSKTKSGVAYGWCIDYGQDKSVDVLYFMHGAGGDEQSWAKGKWIDQLGDVWATERYPRPTVISISFGPQWLLADVNSKRQPAYLPLMLNEIMPKLEKRIGGVKGKRLLMGNSMGGYNSAELALRAPDRFDRVAMLCPGLRVVDPFLSDDELVKAINELPPGADPEYVRGIVDWVREVFGTAANWHRHDPQLIAENSVQLKSAFFVSCSKDDEYGFYQPALKIAETLKQKTSAQWVSIESGGHCAQTPASWKATGEFLMGK